jgi:FkbM family methyltransferase
VARSRRQRPRARLDQFIEHRISTARPRTLERYARLLSPKQTLEPMPDWSFGISYTRNDPRTFARRLIWERYRDEQIDRHVEVAWCRSLKLSLRLGNDVSLAVFLDGMYEPNELAFLAATLQPGMTVIDVGANEGLVSLVSAACVGDAGRVLALEPSSREFDRLQTNLGLNGLVNVEPFRLALYSHAGSSHLSLAELGHEGLNAIGDQIANPGVSVAATETVELETLDAFVAARSLDRLDLVKLDAEGSEARILEGGVASLRRFRPLLLIEVVPEHLAAQGSTVDDLLELLADLDYRVWNFDTDGVSRLRMADEAPSHNVIAAHRDVRIPARQPSSASQRRIRRLTRAIMLRSPVGLDDRASRGASANRRCERDGPAA